MTQEDGGPNTLILPQLLDFLNKDLNHVLQIIQPLDMKKTKLAPRISVSFW
jgi:hypothetical protein